MAKLITKLKQFDGVTYLSKTAGGFSGVPQRTVQNWTEKGFISDPGTTGSGRRRKYSALNCIEIGLIKSMTNMRVSFKVIDEVMGVFRRNQNLLRALECDHYFYFLNLNPENDTKHYGHGFDENERQAMAGHWVGDTFRPDYELTLTINVTAIAKKVISNM